jgi:serine/threonine protein kinase
LLPESKIVTIVQQIVDGMKYLHMKSVVHRDIKPANILKGKDGWKIADFGFAIFSNL